tara:strand:- start:4287 stop:4667 length:381 start_codon:yes stop_codon:yes gene_type:complete
MYNLIRKSIAGTKDNLKEMIVWTNCTLKQNRLIITRTLKQTGLEQVYICKKEWANDYLINTIWASGRYSHSFTQYKGLSGFARVYDTEHFKNTGEVIVFDDFRNYFGASANRWIAVANEISGYDCK